MVRKYMVSSILPKNKQKITILGIFYKEVAQDSDFLFVFWENWGNHNLFSRLSDVYMLFIAQSFADANKK